MTWQVVVGDVVLLVLGFVLGFAYCAWSLRRYVEKHQRYWTTLAGHVHEPESHVHPHDPPPFDQDAE